MTLAQGFLGGSGGKHSICIVEDLVSITGLGRSPGEGNDYPLQHSCLENSKDRGGWQVTVHGVTELTRLSSQPLDPTETCCRNGLGGVPELRYRTCRLKFLSSAGTSVSA